VLPTFLSIHPSFVQVPNWGQYSLLKRASETIFCDQPKRGNHTVGVWKCAWDWAVLDIALIVLIIRIFCPNMLPAWIIRSKFDNGIIISRTSCRFCSSFTIDPSLVARRTMEMQPHRLLCPLSLCPTQASPSPRTWCVALRSARWTYSLLHNESTFCEPTAMWSLQETTVPMCPTPNGY
jgi:hypothetical protein